MRVVFMGTPDFAVPSLRALLKNQYEVAAVVTQPDRPAGRGKKMRSSPVKTAALEAGLPVYQPGKIRDPAFIETLRVLSPDVVVVAAFGQILPAGVLNMPPYGCINVHASLLPAYRGAAPIHRAVINGETETGVTIMQMDTGLDTGDIIIQEAVAIGPDDTVGMVHDRLAALGGELLVRALEQIKGGRAQPIPQDDAKSSYAPMLTRGDEIIDWRRDARSIKNQVRGLNPWPGARTSLDDKLLKIWRVDVAEESPAGAGPPGRVLEADAGRGILVQTGRGMIIIEELQLQGKKSMDAAQFLRGNPVAPGTILGAGQTGGDD